jgi:hypothetical protein
METAVCAATAHFVILLPLTVSEFRQTFVKISETKRSLQRVQLHTSCILAVPMARHVIVPGYTDIRINPSL